MSKKQAKYRRYLQSAHWANLRGLALIRDGLKCSKCGNVTMLQVHHVFYRGTPEGTLLEDLRTLCRECHRQEHHIGPDGFELKFREIELCFRYQKQAPASAWKELKALIETDDHLHQFAELIFQYINYHLAGKRANFTGDYWMDKEKSEFWWRRASRVRKSIRERIQ